MSLSLFIEQVRPRVQLKAHEMNCTDYFFYLNQALGANNLLTQMGAALDNLRSQQIDQLSISDVEHLLQSSYEAALLCEVRK